MISPINAGNLRNYVDETQKKMCKIKDEAGNIIGKYYEREDSTTPPIVQLCPDPIDNTYHRALLENKNDQNVLQEARKQAAKVYAAEEKELKEKGYIIHSHPEFYDSTKIHYCLEVAGADFVDLGTNEDYESLSQDDILRLVKDAKNAPRPAQPKGNVFYEDGNTIIIERTIEGSILFIARANNFKNYFKNFIA